MHSRCSYRKHELNVPSSQTFLLVILSVLTSRVRKIHRASQHKFAKIETQ